MRLFLAIDGTVPASWRVWRICPSLKHFFLVIARELNAPTADRWYRCMFFNLRLEMEAYLRYEKAFERIVSGCPVEDCEDGMEYNEEWEDEEYDPDEV